MTKFIILFLLSTEFRTHLSFLFRFKLYLGICSKNYDYKTTRGVNEYSGVNLNEDMYQQEETVTGDNLHDENVNDLSNGLNYSSSFSRRTKKTYEFKILNTNKKFCIRV